MEARQTLGASAGANGLRILLAAFVAAALVGAFALIGRDLGASSGSGYTVVHPAAGTVLRQDNPPQTVVYPAAGTVLRQDNPAVASQAPSIYVQGGRPQAVYDEIARLEHH